MQEVFVVRDNATNASENPMFFPAVGAAKRAFMDAVNKPETAYNRHPDDYTLFHLGQYDPFKMEFHPLQAPISMGLANTFINSEA